MTRRTNNEAYEVVDEETGEVIQIPSIEDKVRKLLDEGWLLMAGYCPSEGEKIIACDVCLIGHPNAINPVQVWRWDDFACRWYNVNGEDDKGHDFIVYKPYDGEGWEV